MRKIRILVANAPEEIGGVTVWRMFWPLRHLAHKYHDLVDIQYSRGQIFPFEFYQTDILLCYRPSEPAHLAVMQQAKTVGCKIVCDYDDDYLNLAVGHPAYWSLGTRKHIIQQALELTDLLWVSTEALAQVYKHANTLVLPNAMLPEDLQDHPADWRKKTFVWAGSDAHREDVDVYVETYRALLRRADRFVWINFMPTWAVSVSAEKNTRVDLQPWVHTEKYLDWMRLNDVTAIWKPLLSNQFNRGKTNIAWMVATACGAICITNQAGQPGWEFALKELPKTYEHFSQQWQDSRDYLVTKYNLEAWNETRLHSLLKLANHEHPTIAAATA